MQQEQGVVRGPEFEECRPPRQLDRPSPLQVHSLNLSFPAGVQLPDLPPSCHHSRVALDCRSQIGSYMQTRLDSGILHQIDGIGTPKNQPANYRHPRRSFQMLGCAGRIDCQLLSHEPLTALRKALSGE
jgi:hypothetical protein